jgi:TPR repeat protein
MKTNMISASLVATLLFMAPALCLEKHVASHSQPKTAREMSRASARPAVKALTKRAYAGNAKAQYALAKMYEEGTEGLPKNFAIALSWYEEAARNGMKLAAARLQHLEEEP